MSAPFYVDVAVTVHQGAFLDVIAGRLSKPLALARDLGEAS